VGRNKIIAIIAVMIIAAAADVAFFAYQRQFVGGLFYKR